MAATGSGTSGVLDEIAAERADQRCKWGDEHDDLHTECEWLALHQIRLGQVGSAYTDDYHGLRERRPSKNVPALREQLVKAAAVLVAHVEAIDRRSA